VDRLTPQRRSWLMSRVGGKNTTPEIVVRKAAHSLGLRFRLHRKDLPGTPDLVFPKWRIAIFVHGCFWHRHSGCRKAGIPKTRTSYWQEKLDSNVRRDKRNIGLLRERGWSVFTVWECETKNVDTLRTRLRKAFEKRKPLRSRHIRA
jgi:DNA mismatch endonuclease (patch repair protein)